MHTNINAELTALLGADVEDLQPLSGGCVGEVYRAGLSDGRTVVLKAAQPNTPEALASF